MDHKKRIERMRKKAATPPAAQPSRESEIKYPEGTTFVRDLSGEVLHVIMPKDLR